MNDFFENKGIKNESRISIVLNTFMYIDKCIPFVELGGIYAFSIDTYAF